MAPVDATERGAIVPGMIIECQVKEGGEWSTIGFAEADTRRGEPMRCPRCHGAVKPYKLEGIKPHFGHYAAHAGCAATPPVLHPKALA